MKVFDFFPYHPNLSTNSDYGVKTSFGGILSILLGVLTISALGAFGRDLVLKTNPVTTVSEIPNFTPTLNNSQIFLGLNTAYSGGIGIPEWERLITIKYGYIDVDGERTPPALYKFHDSENCVKTNEYFVNNLESMKSSISQDYKTYNCPPKEFNYDVKGSYGAGKFLSWDIRFSKCINSTSNNFKCKSDEEIRTALRSFFGVIIISDHLVDPQNNSDPISIYYKSYILRLSSNISRQDTISFRIINFQSDEGFIMEDVSKKDSFHVYLKSTDLFVDNNPDYYLRLLISLEKSTLSIRRNYTKIQKVAADVGGIIKFLMIFFTMASNSLSKIVFFRYIKERLLMFDKMDQTSPFKYLQPSIMANISDNDLKKESKLDLVREAKNELKLSSNNNPMSEDACKKNFPYVNNKDVINISNEMRSINNQDSSNLISVQSPNYVISLQQNLFNKPVNKESYNDNRVTNNFNTKNRNVNDVDEKSKNVQNLVMPTLKLDSVKMNKSYQAIKEDKSYFSQSKIISKVYN